MALSALTMIYFKNTVKIYYKGKLLHAIMMDSVIHPLLVNGAATVLQSVKF